MLDFLVKNYDILVDIIVPLLAALIGGGITMGGVAHTIKHEHKNTLEQTRKAAKPWIFSLDMHEHFDKKNTGTIRLEGNSPLGGNATIEFILRNTDNGIGIIKKFVTKNNEYLPIIGRILDKNSTNTVIVNLNKEENLEDMLFIISDVYGNEYKYQAYQTGNICKGNHIKEIGPI